MSIFGYENTKTFGGINKNELMNGEIVDCLIIDIDFPYQFKKEVPANELSHKKHGISIHYAILQRNRCEDKEPYEKCFVRDESGQGLIEPKYSVYSMDTQYPPELIFSKFRSSQKGGANSSVNLQSGKIIPKIVDLLPAGFPEKDWTTGVVANAIPPGFESKYAGLIEKENQRFLAWRKVIEMWDGLSEDNCKDMLLNAIASRLLLCSSVQEDGTKFVYTKPQVGMLFRGRIKRAKDSKYFNIESFAWNSDKKEFQIFSTLDVKSPDMNAELTAKTIQELKLANIKARQMNKTNKAETEYVKPDEDMF